MAALRIFCALLLVAVIAVAEPPAAGMADTDPVYLSPARSWLNDKVTAQWEVRRPKTVTNGSVASDIIDVVLTFPSTGYGGFGFAGSRMSGLFVICFLPQGGVREGYAPSCTLFDGVGFVATEVKGHLRLLNYTYLDNGFNRVAYRTSAQFVKAVPGISRCIYAHGNVKWETYEPVYHGAPNRGSEDTLVYGGIVTPQPAAAIPTPPPPYPTAPPLPAPSGSYTTVVTSPERTFLSDKLKVSWVVRRPAGGGDDEVDITFKTEAGGWAGFGTAPQFMQGPQLVCAMPSLNLESNARCQMYAGKTQTNEPNLTAKVTTVSARYDPGRAGHAEVTARVLAKDLGFFAGSRRCLFALGEFNFGRNLAQYHGPAGRGALSLDPYAAAPTPVPATPAPATPVPATPVPETPVPETPVPTTPAPPSPDPVTPAPTTSAPATPAPTTPAPETPVTPTPVTPSPETATPETPTPATPTPATPTPATPSPATPAPNTPAPTTPTPMTPAPVAPTPAPETPVPATPAPVTPASATPAPPTPVPVTPVPETVAPTPAPVPQTPAPASTRPQRFTSTVSSNVSMVAFEERLAAVTGVPKSQIVVTSKDLGNGKKEITFHFEGTEAGNASSVVMDLGRNTTKLEAELGLSGIHASPMASPPGPPVGDGGDGLSPVVIALIAAGAVSVIVGVAVVVKLFVMDKAKAPKDGLSLHGQYEMMEETKHHV